MYSVICFCCIFQPGTVKKVHPDGYVDVQWDKYGLEERVVAGAGGKFHVELVR
jgi:hypothetical protein